MKDEGTRKMKCFDISLPHLDNYIDSKTVFSWVEDHTLSVISCCSWLLEGYQQNLVCVDLTFMVWNILLIPYDAGDAYCYQFDLENN